MQKENLDIVKILLNHEKLDINITYKNIVERNNADVGEKINIFDLENIGMIKLLLANEKIDINFFNTLKKYRNDDSVLDDDAYYFNSNNAEEEYDDLEKEAVEENRGDIDDDELFEIYRKKVVKEKDYFKLLN